MTDHTDPLRDLRIASPCSADWHAMTGDERSRFCAQCKLHVHDLSAMTRDEATALLRNAASGRVCVRFFRRADGRVLTRDCPVGLRQKLRRAWARAAALWCGLFVGAQSCTRPQPDTGEAPAQPQPVEPTPAKMGEVEMGDYSPPAPPLQGKVQLPGAVPLQGEVQPVPVEPGLAPK